MASLNRATLIGNAGRDPETRHSKNGDPITNLSLATTESWTDKNSGEKKSRTEWHRVVFFGPICEVVSKYVHKGSRVFVEGQIKTRKWTDPQGQERYSTEIVVQGREGKIVLLDGARANGEAKPKSVQDPADEDIDAGAGELDDDIPF